MNYVPILFNAEMVKAILESRKTQTRRLIKPQPTSMLTLMPYRKWGSASQMHVWTPPACAGDVLWVRETWAPFCINKNTCRNVLLSHDCYCYKAGPDVCVDEFGCKWHPSIHMPKEAARIFLKVKDVQMERLQAITHEEVIAEGTPATMLKIGHPDNPYKSSECIRYYFDRLWDSTIIKADLSLYGWRANPWVWVIEFERIDKPAKWPNV